VWFLGGHFDKSLIDNFPVIRGSSTHPLTIPNGKYLFFPIVNMADVNGIEVPGKILVDNQDTARKMVGDYVDSITKIICTLDDTPVVYNHLTPIVRTQTPNLNLSPNPNDFGFTITKIVSYFRRFLLNIWAVMQRFDFLSIDSETLSSYLLIQSTR
jgi:hypothetical protein